MKKICAVCGALLLSSAVFAFNLEFKHVPSAENVSSFGIFKAEFDTFVDTLYWQEAASGGLKSYTGIADNYVNAGFSYHYKKMFASFTFFEKVANYKDWPDNQTDLGLSVMFGTGSFAIQGRYYDFCYSGGWGEAMPGCTVANVFDFINGFKLRASAGIDFYYRFMSANKADVNIPQVIFKLDCSKDPSNGAGIKYICTPYVAGANNVTDVSKLPDTHQFDIWYGLTKDFDGRVTAGIRPSFMCIFNTANPTESLYNVYSDQDAVEFLFRLPFALKYTVNETVQLVFSVLFGQYYASFDHIGYTGLGGSNKAGWVTENGLGLGVNLNISPKCLVKIGSNFIRIQEASDDGSDYSYKSQNISASSIAESPLAVSVYLKF